MQMLRALFAKARKWLQRPPAVSDKELTLIIHLTYLAILERLADPPALAALLEAMRRGLSVEALKDSLVASAEARGVPDAREADDVAHMMGSGRILTRALWSARLEETRKASAAALPAQPLAQPFAHAGRFDVTAIASLYKGGPFIRRFLDNIVSQSIFNRSELIIVDADSPDGEFDEIKRFQERFPNIVYHRAATRIGIYEAWNIGVGLARGRCLTNVNLDDLRRRDSFETQFEALEQSGADVVYQNFYYTLDATLNFEEIAAIGFASELPQATPTTLAQLNAPHNGPMWRRDLHDAVGLFDARFKVVGDWEFWLRCATQGKRFHRIDTPHIAYFLNPDGLSTRPSASALAEHREVCRRYRGLLIEALGGAR